MTTAEFQQWLKSKGLTQAQAAELLAATQGQVSYWWTGKRPVPRRIARIIELLNRDA